jgi:uncharacterized RDD family membrane protein YckC
MVAILRVRTDLKVSILFRLMAKMIDLLCVFILAMVLPYPVGPLLGFVYSLLSDGMNFWRFRGQSLGKKLMRLQTIKTTTQAPASWVESLYRNTPIGIATFFGIIPVWGWLMLCVIGVPLLMMEIYLMLSAETGHRLGDVMADTEVVEVKKC